MNEEIECYFQQTACKVNGLDSPYFPDLIDRIPNVHRLKIHASIGKYEHLFQGLHFKDIKWITFLSSINNNIIEMHKYSLSWIEKLFFGEIIDGNLFYTLQDNLEVVKIVNCSGLWDLGAGIVLPIPKEEDVLIRKSIQVQLSINKFCKSLRYTKSILESYNCLLLSNADAYGIDIIWKSSWKYSDVITEWSNELSVLYPWNGEFNR